MAMTSSWNKGASLFTVAKNPAGFVRGELCCVGIAKYLVHWTLQVCGRAADLLVGLASRDFEPCFLQVVEFP